jgi:hypothetical protein
MQVADGEKPRTKPDHSHEAVLLDLYIFHVKEFTSGKTLIVLTASFTDATRRVVKYCLASRSAAQKGFNKTYSMLYDLSLL